MKTVCMLGQNGFIGKTVLEVLRKNFEMVDASQSCDVLVNCAGFSRMYEAQKNPSMMEHVEDYTFDRIANVPFTHIIHLSSIYIEASPDHAYSKFKRRMEQKILSIYPDATIFRLASVLGKDLQKNVIFDLSQSLPLWVTPDSVYNYISSEEVGNIITHFVNNPVAATFNVGASESISVFDVVELTKCEATYGKKKDTVFMDVSYLQKHYKVKTSREYVREYWETITC